MEEIRKYCAFISYRHKELDKSIAKKIHSKIEHYTVPKEMRKSWGGKKLGKVFRDEEELPVSSNLSDSIYLALDNSDYLIVICTPDTPESLWVEREINYFIEKHGRDHVVAVLANGTPETSFPKPLTTVVDENGNEIGTVEPLAANLTGVDHKHSTGRLNKEVVRLYAAIMGCPFDSLWQREKRQRLHRILALVSVLAAAAIVYGVSIYVKNIKIEKQKDEIEQKAEQIENQKNQIQDKMIQLEQKKNEIEQKKNEIEQQKNEIEKKNEEITAQNSELVKQEAEALIKKGELLYERGEIRGAVQAALEAVASPEGRESYADEAEHLLSSALGAAHYDNKMKTVAVAEQESEIEEVRLIKNDSCAVTLDVIGDIRCFSTVDGSLVWRNKSSGTFHRYVTNRERLVEVPEYGLLLCISEDLICAFSENTGEKVWYYALKDTMCVDFYALSKERSRIALIEISESASFLDTDYNITLLNTKDGSVEKKIPVGDKFKNLGVKSAGSYSGAFSDDGKTLYGLVYYSDLFFDYKGFCIFSVDIKSGEISILKEGEYAESQSSINYCPFVIGMEYCKEQDSVIIVHYDSEQKQILIDELSTESGTVETIYNIDYTLPGREANGSYASFFERKGDVLYFSCQELCIAYGINNKRILFPDADNNGKYLSASPGNIFEFTSFDDEYREFAFLNDEGRLYIYPATGGYIIADFGDKRVLLHIDISKDYAYSRTGGYGFEMNEATELVVCAVEPKKMYILKPDKDPEYENTDWYDTSVKGVYSGSLTKLKYDGDGKFVLWEASEQDKASVSVLDAFTGSKQKIEIDTTDTDSTAHATNMLSESLLWSDKKHITYAIMGLDMGIYNLEKGQRESVFERDYSYAASFTKLNDGRVLHAGICETPNSLLSDRNFEVCYRIDDGEIVHVENTTGKQLVSGAVFSKTGFIKATKTGRIYVALYSDNENMVDSFLIINTEDGSSKTISLEGSVIFYYDNSTLSDINDISFKMDYSDETSDFCIMSRDGAAEQESTFRLYDYKSGEVKKIFTVPHDIRNITSVKLIKDDEFAAVWTKDKMLYIYEISTGENRYGGFMAYEKITSATEVELFIAEDPERKRIFFYTTNGAAKCLSTETWKLRSEFFGFSAFCPETNEIYRLKNWYMDFIEEDDDVIKVKAYTLDDLIEKGKALLNGDNY
ncbi:MAG: TIR domain-containing protein [Lachnospiraceae bacterium]|nr:TIR domain-containing protein [Lachnospiraceae bacterium]